MDEAELVLLEQLYQSVFEEQFPEGQLSVVMLKTWHRRWLGNIYKWAGQVRNAQRISLIFVARLHHFYRFKRKWFSLLFSYHKDSVIIHLMQS